MNLNNKAKVTPITKIRGTIKKRASLFLCTILVLGTVLFGAGTINNFLNHSNLQTVDLAPANTTLSVTFLDVGQGNCVIAESDGHYMLIDGGDGKHSSFVVSYLKDLGITVLDYIVISHYDADHLSGIVGVLNNYDVNTVLAPDYKVDTRTFASYISIMEKKNYKAIHPLVGDEFHLGNASFQIVSPLRYDNENENNNSIGLKLSDASHSFLILGDTESESELELLDLGIDLSCDVYMVSHHGSLDASSDELLNSINASVAVISVGENEYGHPNSKTLNRLSSHLITILRTDQDGTLIAYSGNDFLKWNINFDTQSIKTIATTVASSTSAISGDVISANLSYIGNKKSKIFHLATCPNLPASYNQISLDSRESALNSGYSACGVCHP